MEQVTTEKLKSFDDVGSAIKWASYQLIAPPERILRPNSLKSTHNSSDVKKYLEELIQYEQRMEKYELHSENAENINNKINSVVLEFIKESSGLYGIPKTYQDPVLQKALSERAPSEAYLDVYLKIKSLVEIF